MYVYVKCVYMYVCGYMCSLCECVYWRFERSETPPNHLGLDFVYIYCMYMYIRF